MNFTEFLSRVDNTLQQSLGAAGFGRSGAGTWNRCRGEELNVVWFQKHSSEASFCVNLGFHFVFLPKAGTEAPLSIVAKVRALIEFISNFAVYEPTEIKKEEIQRTGAAQV